MMAAVKMGYRSNDRAVLEVVSAGKKMEEGVPLVNPFLLEMRREGFKRKGHVPEG